MSAGEELKAEENSHQLKYSAPAYKQAVVDSEQLTDCSDAPEVRLYHIYCSAIDTADRISIQHSRVADV